MNDTPIEIVHGRANPLVDPVLHVWGWEIPVYLFLGGLVAGLMVVLAALELRAKGVRPTGRLALAPWLGVALLAIGMGTLFLDLEHKVHVFRFYTTFEPTSPMSWGAWILLAVFPALSLLGLGSLSDATRGRLLGRLGSGWLRRTTAGLLEWSDRRRRAILWATAAAGVALGTYTGILLGALGARPLWSSGVLGPLFLASGVSSGAAFLLLLRPGADAEHTLVRWDVAAIGVELVLLGLLLLGHATGGAPARAAAALLLGGAWTPWFWSLVVVGGLVIPLALELTEVRRHLAMTVATPLLVLAGGLALRAILVAAGQSTSFAMIP